jgi:pimeloyl-ACP methyl ester carboxylesterase
MSERSSAKYSTNLQSKTPAFSDELFPRKKQLTCAIKAKRSSGQYRPIPFRLPRLALFAVLVAVITVSHALAVPPSATTNAATNITSSGAVFNGTINPNGSTTNVYFEYGNTTSYGNFTGSANFSGTSSIAVQSTLSGANPNTTFHYRVVAGSSGGAAYGNDVSFTTLGNAPGATTNAATNVGSGSATLNGTVNPNGGATTTYFQFGLSTDYGATTSSSNVGSGISSVSVHADTGPIQPNQTFHYRAVATNNSGTTYGQDLTFVTSAMAPSATTDAATSVTSTSAQVNATVNPNGSTTSVYFQYGLTSSYGSQNTPANFSGTSPLPILAQMSGLNPSTTYHYRVVASNNGGTTYGGDMSFATSGSAPIATTNAATNITSSSAILNGTVNPNGGATTTYFQFGLSTDYGATTSSSNVGSGTSAVSFQTSTGAIQPGQTFHYRLVATNAAGTAYGNDLTFTTLNDAPYALTNAASNVAANSFQGNGTINPNGLSTTAYFQYGLTPNYTTSSPPGTFTGSANLSVFATLNTNIQPNTTYHYRVVASSSAGTTYGNDIVLTTPGGPTPSPTTTPTPIPTATVSSTPTATPSITPTATPIVQVFLSLHSLRTDAISNVANADVDDPLLPAPDETRLGASQPSAEKGLVADGVTPLLIEIDSLSAPAQSTTFNVIASVSSGSMKTGGPDLKTLHHPAGSAANFSTSGTVVLSSTHPTGFAYISAIRCEDVKEELSVNLTVQQSDAPSNIKQLSFEIRRPPVVLVHGFDSDKRTWSEEFLNALSESRHRSSSPGDNFVVPINYGVDPGSGDPKFRNRTGSFTSLAQDLDLVLSSQIETTQIAGTGAVGTYKDWALTRYDLICHSQGGVLARMLCTTNAKTAFGVYNEFISERNANRGRFRRIITIGSPQNGSRLSYYVSKLQTSLSGYSIPANLIAALGYLQEKFSPFGHDIGLINNAGYQVESEAKFHIIRGQINGGRTTGASGEIPPPCYWLVGLDEHYPLIFGPTIGSVVLPRGSDGVVDFESQTAAQPEGGVVSTVTIDVSHSGPEFLSGVPTNSTETGSPEVATEAIVYLDQTLIGPVLTFGSFRLPFLLGDSDRDAIDKVVPGTLRRDILSVSGGATLTGKQSGAAPPSTSLELGLTPDASEPFQGNAHWSVEVFGPRGVSTDGLTLQVDPADSTRATLYVDEGVEGDVIIYGNYFSTNGRLVFGTPVVAVSRPVGANLIGISIEPSTATVSVGDHFPFQIWGDYDNGERALLYEPVGDAAQYTSSNPLIVSVGTDNRFSADAVGTATVHVAFRGLTAESIVVVKDPLTSRLANIATRGNVGTGDNALIAGFIITGTQSKKIIVRGIGSSLPLADRLANPTLELRDSSGALLDSNDNWVDSPNKQAIIDSTVQPTNDLESAIVATLPANGSNYTAVLRGTNDGTGIGVVEAYDLDQTVDSKLANISTRGFVDTGDSAMIGGMIITGGTSTSVLVRAMGPSLTDAGVSNALQDPTLELYDGNGALITLNDNWRETQEGEILGTSIPPTDDRESAVLVTLPPGAYTAIVRGKDNSTGVALVEAYQLGN